MILRRSASARTAIPASGGWMDRTWLGRRQSQEGQSGSGSSSQQDNQNSGSSQGDKGKDGSSQSNGDSNDQNQDQSSSKPTSTKTESTSTTTFHTPKQRDQQSSTSHSSSSSTTKSSKTSSSSSTTTSSTKSDDSKHKDSNDSNKDSSTKTTSTTRDSDSSKTTSSDDSSHTDDSNHNSNDGNSNGQPKDQNSNNGNSAASTTFQGQASTPLQTPPPITSIITDPSTSSVNPLDEPSISFPSVVTDQPTTLSSVSPPAAISCSNGSPSKASVTAAPQSSHSALASTSSHASSLNSAVIAGASVGAIAGLVLLVALIVLCVRGKFRGLKLQTPRFPSFHSTSFTRPQLPSRARNAPIIRTLFPTAPFGLVPERPERSEDHSFVGPRTEKQTEPEVVHEVMSEKSISPKLDREPDDPQVIDPGFMREISTIMEDSSQQSNHLQSPDQSIYQHSHHPSGTLSVAESTYSQGSNALPTSVKSNSTIILPGSFINHSRNASDTDSLFAPTRLNSAVGPWRDSLWSTTATPTAMLPPSSAFASQRHSRRSLSLSARIAQARGTDSWAEDSSRRSTRRSSQLLPQSMMLPPLPTPGFGRSSPDQNAPPQEQNAQQSRARGIFGSPWPLR